MFLVALAEILLSALHICFFTLVCGLTTYSRSMPMPYLVFEKPAQTAYIGTYVLMELDYGFV
jgi:hypothetical protein